MADAADALRIEDRELQQQLPPVWDTPCPFAGDVHGDQIQHLEPELRRLVLTDPHAQHVFVAVQINTDVHVGHFVHNDAVLLHLKVNRIQEHDSVYGL